MVLVGFQFGGLLRHLYHVFQGEYELLNNIDCDGRISRFFMVVLMSLGG